MASPQPDRFVRFSKELYDAVLRAPWSSASEIKVFLAVVRLTYGDRGKLQVAASITSLMRATGLGKTATKRAADSLLREGALIEVRPPSFGQPRILAPNKDYQRWGSLSVDPAAVPDFFRHDWERDSADERHSIPERRETVSANGTKQYPRTAPSTDETREQDLTSSPDGEDAAIAAATEDHLEDGCPVRGGDLKGAGASQAAKAALGTHEAGAIYNPKGDSHRIYLRLCERVCQNAHLRANVPCEARLPVCKAALVEIFASVGRNRPANWRAWLTTALEGSDPADLVGDDVLNRWRALENGHAPSSCDVLGRLAELTRG